MGQVLNPLFILPETGAEQLSMSRVTTLSSIALFAQLLIHFTLFQI